MYFCLVYTNYGGQHQHQQQHMYQQQQQMLVQPKQEFPGYQQQVHIKIFHYCPFKKIKKKSEFLIINTLLVVILPSCDIIS